MTVWPADNFQDNVGWARGTAIYGTIGGLLIGGLEARTIHRARIAERQAARTDYVESQREWVTYMNELLRHEVLNTANIIDGYTGLLLATIDDPEAREQLRTIRRQAQGMADVITDAQVLLKATEEPEKLTPVSLPAVLHDEIEALRFQHPTVDIEHAIDTGVVVAADDLCSRLASNLLENAVEHNPANEPWIGISLERTDETALIVIEDDGPGIPSAKQETLFDGDTQTDSHGLGLSLVGTLAERYDGSVELQQTDSSGSKFVIRLPLLSVSSPGNIDDPPVERARIGE